VKPKTQEKLELQKKVVFTEKSEPVTTATAQLSEKFTTTKSSLRENEVVCERAVDHRACPTYVDGYMASVFSTFPRTEPNMRQVVRDIFLLKIINFSVGNSFNFWFLQILCFNAEILQKFIYSSDLW